MEAAEDALDDGCRPDSGEDDAEARDSELDAAPDVGASPDVATWLAALVEPAVPEGNTGPVDTSALDVEEVPKPLEKPELG